MTWHSLPSDLFAKVLLHMSLPQLRLLKAVSSATANTCRAVLRSKEWCLNGNMNGNLFYMDEELKTQCSSYKLPLKVTIFHDRFKEGCKCIATVYRLKLLRMTDHGVMLNPRDIHEWSGERQLDDSIDTIIGDMCIEIHGQGIVGSEYSLRRMIQQMMRVHGSDNVDRGSFADKLNTIQEADVDEYGNYSVGGKGNDELPLNTLLSNICSASEITPGRWEVHEAPFSGQNGRDFCEMDVLTMCQMGLGLFV
jgi:hypothetical protein